MTSIELPAANEGEPASVHSAQLLRAECYCPVCRHKETNQRLVDIASCAGVTMDAAMGESGSLRVSFSDGHESEFSARWLRAHAPSVASAGQADLLDGHAKALQSALSSSSAADLMPSGTEALPLDLPLYVDWAVVASGGAGLANALMQLKRHGAVVFQGAGTQPDVVPTLAESLGGVRATHYGSDFRVLSKAQPDSVANTGHALGFHTDLPYRHQPPELQLLHCLQNEATGGESTLTDGFVAASRLFEADRRAFSLLATVPVRFSWQGASGVLLSAERPMLDLSPAGGLRAVHLDNRNTSVRFVTALTDPGLADELLAAYTRLSELITEESSVLRYRLGPGDAVLFNNRRLLHGRDAFDPTSGARELHGCYLDMDMLESKLLAIEHEQAGDSWDAPSNFSRPADWAR